MFDQNSFFFIDTKNARMTFRNSEDKKLFTKVLIFVASVPNQILLQIYRSTPTDRRTNNNNNNNKRETIFDDFE